MSRILLVVLLISCVIAAAGYQYHIRSQMNSYGTILICTPNDESNNLAFGKYASDRSKLLCAGFDGYLWLGMDLVRLYELGYRIAQIIPEWDGVVYYVHKAK